MAADEDHAILYTDKHRSHMHQCRLLQNSRLQTAASNKSKDETVARIGCAVDGDGVDTGGLAARWSGGGARCSLLIERRLCERLATGDLHRGDETRVWEVRAREAAYAR